MREADLLVARLPTELREPMRKASRRVQASPHEVAAAVEEVVREAIIRRFGATAEAAELVIAEAVLARRKKRDDKALSEIEAARRPKLREAV